MRQKLLMAFGLLCLAGCATDSKNVAATTESEPVQAAPAEGAAAPSESTETETQAASAEPAAAPAAQSEAGEKAGEAEAQADTTKPDPTTQHTAKPAAPVELVCTPRGDTIHLAIEFLGSGRDVNVEVWGTDGLEVQGDAHPIRAQAVERGSKLELEVPFKAPDDVRSYLAIQVSGRFGDRNMGTVRSCTIHPEFPDQDNENADIRVDEQGRKIRVVHPE